jgi:hypothetical protein
VGVGIGAGMAGVIISEADYEVAHHDHHARRGEGADIALCLVNVIDLRGRDLKGLHQLRIQRHAPDNFTFHGVDFQVHGHLSLQQKSS